MLLLITLTHPDFIQHLTLNIQNNVFSKTYPLISPPLIYTSYI